MTEPTPFELDIAEQPAALRRLAAADFPGLEELTLEGYDRIVLTGMGSSEYAGVPTWRALLLHSLPVWNVDSSVLLDNLDLLTPDTLLVITSQSGASGEVVELLHRFETGETARPRTVVGIADPVNSPLAQAADLHLALRSGPEATVSTKSYLNTLGAHRALVAQLTGGSLEVVRAEFLDAAQAVEAVLAGGTEEDPAGVAEDARATAEHPHRRLAFVARGDESAIARFAGLITKESSKVPAEGFVGGQFRHGPFELAGEGLTVVMFGMSAAQPSESMRRLATDLVTSGSRVLVVGDDEIPGTRLLPAASEGFLGLIENTVIAELFAVQLARANGVVPGQFLYGSKVTTAL